MRKIIGETFIDVFGREAAKLPGVAYLAQGTIYPDVIESAASKFGKAHVIKSQYRGDVAERMKPTNSRALRELFKDEVHGALALPWACTERLIFRHPFPGPGLGVRFLEKLKSPMQDLLVEADAIFIEELRAAGWYEKVSRPSPYLCRTCRSEPRTWWVTRGATNTLSPCALWRPSDFMTARWAHLPYELLETVSNRIINEISGISRADHSDGAHKAPATIEPE